MAEFQTRKDDYTNCRVIDVAPLTPGPGEIVVNVTKFAFTANNITYAVAADMIGYWQFFPPHGDDADGWGIIPVWGFAEVSQSEHSNVPVGEKLFGYFPPAGELKMTPGKVTAEAVMDGAAHRAELPPTYNRYRRVNNEADYDSSVDAELMLLWPLYATSFCLGDALLDNDWYGAEQVVVISASSKTSIGLGYALKNIAGAPPSVGLTSSRNEAFVSGVGVFDSVHSYDALGELDSSKPTAIVDMSGNSELLGVLHEQLGDNMKFTVNVGLTHWDQAAGNDKIIAERSEFFFAPGHIEKRVAEWGPEEFARKSSEFVKSTIEQSSEWLKLTPHQGLGGLSDIYDDVCNGRSAPDEGQIIELV
ncbi:MAG: DUF2855 family protein [Pseudomonadales bacterium]